MNNSLSLFRSKIFTKPFWRKIVLTVLFICTFTMCFSCTQLRATVSKTLVLEVKSNISSSSYNDLVLSKMYLETVDDLIRSEMMLERANDRYHASGEEGDILLADFSTKKQEDSVLIHLYYSDNTNDIASKKLGFIIDTVIDYFNNEEGFSSYGIKLVVLN